MEDNNFCQCETPAPKYGQKDVTCLMCNKPYRRQISESRAFGIETYKSDEDAGRNGVAIGSAYRLSEPNDYKIPGGTIKKRLI